MFSTLLTTIVFREFLDILPVHQTRLPMNVFSAVPILLDYPECNQRVILESNITKRRYYGNSLIKLDLRGELSGKQRGEGRND